MTTISSSLSVTDLATTSPSRAQSQPSDGRFDQLFAQTLDDFAAASPAGTSIADRASSSVSERIGAKRATADRVDTDTDTDMNDIDHADASTVDQFEGDTGTQGDAIGDRGGVRADAARRRRIGTSDCMDDSDDSPAATGCATAPLTSVTPNASSSPSNQVPAEQQQSIAAETATSATTETNTLGAVGVDGLVGPAGLASPSETSGAVTAPAPSVDGDMTAQTTPTSTGPTTATGTAAMQVPTGAQGGDTPVTTAPAASPAATPAAGASAGLDGSGTGSLTVEAGAAPAPTSSVSAAEVRAAIDSVAEHSVDPSVGADLDSGADDAGTAASTGGGTDIGAVPPSGALAAFAAPTRAAMSTAQTATATPLSTPADPATANARAMRERALLGAASSSEMKVDLSDEGLGSLTLQAVQGAGGVHLTLTAADAATRALLTEQGAALRQDLESNGTRVGSLDINQPGDRSSARRDNGPTDGRGSRASTGPSGGLRRSGSSLSERSSSITPHRPSIDNGVDLLL